MNGIEQILIAERFSQNSIAPTFIVCDCHWNVAMSIDENDGNLNVGLGHPLLQIEPAQRHIRTLAAQELLRRGGNLDSQPDRPNKVLRLTKRRIVVNDEYGPLWLGHSTVSLPIGNVNWKTAPCSAFARLSDAEPSDS